jgi:predicted metal-dependent phosphoesterase TrpH
MILRIDIHVHTSRFSACSTIDPLQLVSQAVRAGLDGLVITEHHRQWDDPDLAELLRMCNAPEFVLLSGFEYSSTCGDLLVYGLTPAQAQEFERGWDPEKAVRVAERFGGVCVAAHPTRAQLGFDERLFSLPLVGLEVCSTNLNHRERRLALDLSRAAKVAPLAASDAHNLYDVGRYATAFEEPVCSMWDLQEALTHGRFHLTEPVQREIGVL